MNVYAPGANGNVAPVQEINGADTGLYKATGVVVDGKGKIYVSSVQPGSPSGCCITTYPKNANGDVAPIQAIAERTPGSPHPMASGWMPTTTST